MSKKFTGITSAGSAIPVYDKDAHSALEQKLDTSAFSSVSGEFATVDDVVAAVSGKADTSAIPSLDGYATEEWVGEQGYLTEVPESAVSGFATHEEVQSATSGKADWSGVIEYRNKPSANAIYADGNTLTNVGQIVGSGNFYIVPSAVLQVPNIITATTGGLTARGLTSNSGYGLTANGLTAYDHSAYGGFSANGISAGKRGPLWIQGETEVFSAGGGGGFTFSSVNTGIGTATLTTAAPNATVQTYSPKFEARMSAGAGFSIEGSGARGYDASGNVTWDTSNPPAPTQLIAGYDSPKPSILLSQYMPKSVSAQFSNAPMLSADGNGIYIGISGQNIKSQMQGLTARNGTIRSEMSDNSGKVTAYSYLTGWDAGVYRSSAFGSANSGTWSLTGSVQKREIECDSATSAITAIAGSAIGGKEYSAGANIDITDEVISGKDWSEDIAGATSGLMQTSGLEYDGDKISGYMGSAFAGGGEVPEGVMVESAVGYNAVNEISGYNGSAIAQYGAEKQWLVHDDTLVHAANSAQYALGVNLSAVAQLLGVDETVLYSGTEPTSAISLTETWKNFDRLKIYVQNKSMDNGLNVVEVRPLEREGNTAYYNIIAGFSYGLGTNGMIWQNIIGIATDTTLTNQSAFGFQNSWTATSPTVRKNNANDLNCILKVIGIGRRS